MKTPEVVFFWITSFFYLATFVSAMFYAFFHKESLTKICLWGVRLGYLFHLTTFILRWYYANHIPLGNTYELNLLGTVVTMAIFILLQFITKNHLSYVSLFLCPIAVLVLILGIVVNPQITALSTAYNSYWLFVHVFFAWFAFGCYTIATAFAGVYLWKGKHEKSLPNFYSLEDTDRIMYKLIALGTLFNVVMLIAGAIWANKLFGRYWSWDAVETWALIVFLFYSIYLHARVLLKVQGKTAAWLLFLGFILLAIVFWGLPFVISNVHMDSPPQSLTK